VATLLEVHAHPDDESITSGGLFAMSADRGIHTVLVTCTGGELGEIVDPALEEVRPRLAEVRAGELRAAGKILGIRDIEMLGYRDSGMAGAPENAYPGSFASANFEEAAARLTGLLRKYCPDVVATYDQNGGYGHPDHIQAHRITVRAMDLVADPAFRPELGAPWQPKKLYYTALSRSRLMKFADQVETLGITGEFAARIKALAEEIRKRRMMPEGNAAPTEIPFGVPDEMITATIDARDYIDRKVGAMRAHRTQIKAEAWALTAPPDLLREIWGWESFIRARSFVDAPAKETDVFAGIPI
jgi:N-acetyl-1-D-myo-inositol-2-amino-2-deoxy-alpha-D-glucopyranoside deacetylase